MCVFCEGFFCCVYGFLFGFLCGFFVCLFCLFVFWWVGIMFKRMVWLTVKDQAIRCFRINSRLLTLYAFSIFGIDKNNSVIRYR